MANQYVNKVIVNNEIKMDLTEDTVTPKTLRAGFTAHDASGAPIVGNESLTDISEDGTNAGPILELNAEGWANQTQLTGKNLLPNTGEYLSYKGVTFTVNADGSVTVNGTAEGNAYFSIATNLDIPSDTYTLSDGVNSDDAFVYINPSSKRGTFTGSVVNATIYIADGYTCNNLTFYPQLELGSTATEYEPYCGGIPSPNPNHPQEIRVARGRNLLDITEYTTLGGFTLSGETIIGNNNLYSPAIFSVNVEVGKTYYISATADAVNSAYRVQVNRGGTNVAIRYELFTSASIGFSFVAPTDIVDVQVFGHSSSSGAISVSNIQLELGSRATPYVPYGFVGVEAQGKNLFGSPINKKLAGSSASGFTLSDGGTSFVGDVAPNTTYTICDHSTTVGTRFRIVGFVSAPTSSITQNAFEILPNNDISPRQYTFNSGNANYVVLTIDHETYYPEAKAQLELGSEATEYEPYYHKTIPIPLPERGWVGGLPDGTSDILKLNTAGKYEWVENVEEVVLDGNTSLSDLSINVFENASRVSYDPYALIGKSYALFLANRFNSMQPYSGVRNVGEIWCSSIASRMWFGLPTSVTTSSDAIAYFADHPTTVLYPLATSQTEQGYVPNWDNTLPEHCTIDIPELRDISVRYYLDTASVEPAQRYYERANAELNQVIDDASNDATLEALAAIAPIEGDISSANYLVGAYLIHDNQLCEVTTPIATGEAITVGTNVVISSVATELGEIQTAVQDIIDDPYILPTMSASEKGGAKVGQGLRIDDDILSVDMSSDDATDAGPLISLQAEGWGEQTQYLGVNLLPFPYAGEDTTEYGVTVTVNDDQSVTFSGSFTGSITDSIKWPWYGEVGATNNLITPAGATAIKYITVADKSYNRMIVMNFYDSSGNELVSYSGLQNDTSYSIPSNASGMYVYEMITKLSNTALLPFTASIMLSAGTTTYPYEPYIGGKPSPSPDLPQEIKVAKGRNLAPFSTVMSTANGGVYTKDTSYVVDIDAGVTYTLSLTASASIYVYVDPDDGTSVASLGKVMSNAPTLTFTPNKSGELYFYVPDRIFASSTVVITNIQLEEGSVATPYVPYGYLGCEVQGRNLIPNGPDDSTTYANVTITRKDGVLIFNGTSNGAGGRTNAFYKNQQTNLLAGTYTLSHISSGTGRVNVAVQKLSDNTVLANNTDTQTFTITEPTMIFVGCNLVTNTTYTNLNVKIQLERGTKATPYEPYHHQTIPIPLPSKGFAAALPDGTSDILRLDGAGKWEWESNTNEATVTLGSTLYDISNGLKGAVFEPSDKQYGMFAAMCDRATSVGGQTPSADTFYENPRNFMFVGDTDDTISDLKAKFDGATILYSANPTIEQGYLDNWDNNIPLHATIDIPELRNIGVECYMDEQASTLNAQWSERLRSEMDDSSINAVTESLASLAPVENDISSANYSTGSYLIHNNQLYKVTTAIATGEAISTNTNITSATIANELLDIDSDLLDFSELLEAAKAEYREKFQAIDSWQAAASQLIREDNGYYSNESITRMLAQRFDGKLYGYSEPKTTAVAITKTGANASLANPTLGTATVAGSSAYRHLGPFQWFAAKGIVDSDGIPHVSTIKGIDSDADWDADTNNVWSLRPIQWYSIDSTGGTVIGSLSDTWHLGLKPNPQAYLPDGTLRPYMLAPRYALGFENGVGVSKSGLKGYGRDVSHNSLITKLDYANTGYSGKTIYENWYDIFMSRMIYGTKDFQTIMQGCTSYNYQYHPSVAEQDTTRVILSNANAANLVVGSTMMMGNQATESTDRNNVNAYNIFDGLIIESIIEYDANNKSIELATDATFNTDPAYLFSTAPWHSGSCDAMDWDGSPTNPLSAKECAFFQGCELMTGTYEVLANIILKGEADARQIPYIVHSSRDDATSVTANFIKCGDGLLSNDGTANAWKYPLYIADHNGLLYGEEVGGSTTAGCADGQYVRADSVAADSEWLSVGSLWNGRNTGLSCVVASYGLGYTFWYIWSRLSPVGLSRG